MIPLLAWLFLYGGLRQPDNGHTRKAGGVIHLDFHDDPLEADHGIGENSGYLGLSISRWKAN